MKRADIVAKAREYVGTPFHDKGRVKGGGIDCVGLPLCIAGELGLKDKNGIPMNGDLYNNYSAQPLGNYVHKMCQKHLAFKPVSKMQPGDLVTLMIFDSPCHVAILGDGPDGLTMIHAYSGDPGKCVEHRLDDKWRRRIAGCFSFPGVED